MTSDENPDDGGAAPQDRPAAPARRRMVGYTPLTTQDNAAQSEAVQAEAAGTEGERAPVRKQRMGGGRSAASGQDTTGQEGGAPAAKPSRMASSSGTAGAAPGGVRAGADATRASGKAGGSGTARPAWVRPAAVIAGLVATALVVVLVARLLRDLEPVQQFIATYDGHASQPDTAPEGMPWWMGWQHFFNMFLMVLIIRTGLQVRTERKPPAHWTAEKNSFFSPRGNTPKKVSLSQWLHQSLDVLWVANGIVFVILLTVTEHWMRIVPTSWDVFPNMLSGAVQYASLDWPTEGGWVHYNALQVMAYFVTVFIAAPLAVISGVRFSTWWPEKAERLTKLYPVEWARAVHFPVMLYFVFFTIVHVFLVFFTGALRNLNHMYTSRDVVDWLGLVVFLSSLVVIAAGWFLSKPLFTTPIAQRMGKVSK